MPLHVLGHGRRESVSIDRQGSTGGHSARVGAGQHHRSEAPQFLLQQASRAIRLVGAKAVGANEFS
jgi:hypothetical protein